MTTGVHVIQCRPDCGCGRGVGVGQGVCNEYDARLEEGYAYPVVGLDVDNLDPRAGVVWVL